MIRRLATAVALTTALALGACSSGSFDASMFEVGQTRFLDREPISFRAPAPVSLPVHGVDVAKWQGDIDWRQLRASGVSFAFIKATEGGDHIDSRFLENWREAKAAGVPTGAYHFYYHCRGGAEQARWFIRNVPQASAAPCRPCSTWSGTVTRRTAPARSRAATCWARWSKFLSIVQRHYGQKPIIYATVDFYAEILQGEFKDHDFWVRSTKDHVDDVYTNRDWTFWQYTATGRAPGVDADIDLNAFRGGERAWRKWLKRRLS